jgi:hypothetical protein
MPLQEAQASPVHGTRLMIDLRMLPARAPALSLHIDCIEAENRVPLKLLMQYGTRSRHVP